MRYIRTENGEILELEKTSNCIYSIRNKNVNSDNCYVSYLWNNWKEYYLIDYQNCMLFSYNSAQNFISDLIKENLNYQDLVIELSPYYKDCKQADTIEELCDGFYLDDILLGRFNASGTYDGDSFMFKKAKDLYYGYNKGRIPVEMYGFIKTDKGLIYVAKMDEKGELVLI